VPGQPGLGAGGGPNGRRNGGRVSVGAGRGPADSREATADRAAAAGPHCPGASDGDDTRLFSGNLDAERRCRAFSESSAPARPGPADPRTDR